MWWNCFSSRSNARPSGRKLRRTEEENEAHGVGNYTNNHAHISPAEVVQPGGTIPMPSEDVVNEKFAEIVVSCTRTSFNIEKLEHFVKKWNMSVSNKSLHAHLYGFLCRMIWDSTSI